VTPQTEEQKKIRSARRKIRAFRADEDRIAAESPSRSTGYRNRYKAAYETLAEVEAVLNGRGKK
jgi:hypothetical protein